MAAGLGVAEQHIGQGVSDFHAREPDQEHRRGVVPPGHLHRGAGVDHHHGALVRFDDGADEVVLPARQRQGGPVKAFAFDGTGGPDHHDGDVGGAGRGSRLGDLAVRRFPGFVDGQPYAEQSGLRMPGVAQGQSHRGSGGQDDAG
ncbi:hypothetical protein SRABI128_06011 [Microbacterium sp. Bi128]|nr:hypothetical protein SRABI128_06011 [Microbacterium sp. Bi128]